MKVVPETRNDRALGWLRVALGFIFLVLAQYKILSPEFTGSTFEHWIRQFLGSGSAYPFMVPVLKNFVLKHTAPLAYLVAYGELGIGLSLLLGVLVTPASVCGFFYMLALLFSANYPGAHSPVWAYFGASLNHLIPALCFAAFVRGDSTRSLSLSAWIHSLHERARLKEKLRERGYATNNIFGK